MRRLSLKSTLFGVDPLNGLCPAKPFVERISGEWAKKISHGFV